MSDGHRVRRPRETARYDDNQLAALTREGKSKGDHEPRPPTVEDPVTTELLAEGTRLPEGTKLGDEGVGEAYETIDCTDQ